MKKTLFAVALATAGLVAIPAAFAQDASTQQLAQQGWYVSGEAGYGQVNKGPYDSNGDVVGGVKGGYRFALNPNISLGVEAGYEYLGRVDARGASGNSSLRSKLYGPTLGTSLRYNFTPKWYGEVRAGAFFAEGQGLTDSANPSYQRFDRTRYYAGAGVGYNITQNWSVGVNYNYYDGSGRRGGAQLDTNAVTVAAEYRF
ncbi:outer membrane beta-barrel protein [Dyella psychrodurans]|uniref:Autotransporter domain-containing protein n=1 Tax=Dyella psychrodurans TaxID=1927960 RepID=A0A370X2Y3_9GAMM|nr:outer membrane beta-barrel protein [Dyella psychrodurans]RDS82640.1 autotransporter domain-containing protein [Dyella psychrodurans]